MADARQMLKELALPCPLGDRVKSAIERAAKEADLPYERARKIWYGEARRIEHHEFQKIEQAAQRKRMRMARNELHELKARISRLEALFSSTDPDFHSEALAALRHSTMRTD